MYNQFSYQTADPVYYGQLKEWARENRKYPTEAEAELWKAVRGNKLGHKFLFQYIIGQYIVDFLCPECNACRRGGWWLSFGTKTRDR